MKISRYSVYGLLLAAVGTLTGCQDDYDAPSLNPNDKATWEANITIAELKDMFKDEASMKIPYKDEATKTPYIVKGRVISADETGNIFKSLVIQDEDAALQISVNKPNLYTMYRVGQEVLVNATDLWGGMYHNLVCLGYGANEYGSLVTSRMAPSIFAQHVQKKGLPVQETQYINLGEKGPSDTPYCVVINDFTQIPLAGEDYVNIQSQLVEFNNVEFIGGGTLPYANSDESVNRTLVDANGNQLAVRNSGMSTFFNTILPTGKGTVRGILSYYGSNPNSLESFQLLIRDLNDVVFDGKGSKESPYTVEDVLGMRNNGRTSWAAGYIVGSVKAGVTEVTSNEDIIFGAAAELPNNVVIADSPDCKDYTKCVAVELPQGTILRRMVNMVDNEDVYKEKLTVNGKFKSYLGMYGVIGSEGEVSDFNIGDKVMGTEEYPYDVDFVIDLSLEMSDVWIEGYVVGFVEGSSYSTGAQFNNNAQGANYNNGNLIISKTKDATDVSLAIPVRLKTEWRQILGMAANPDILGKKIKFKGNTGNYLNWFGISTTSDYKLVEDPAE